MARQMPHDVHLPPHILDVDGGPQLLLRYRLAGESLAGGLIGAQVGDSELSPAELLAELVPAADVPAVGILEDGELGGGGLVVI